jgi:hypothetical protein
MSTNLDLVPSIYADRESGDFKRADWADPEIEFEVIGSVSTEARTGVSGMAEGFRDFLSTGADYGVEADEYRELDSGRVLVPVHATSGRAKTSGVDMRWVRRTERLCITKPNDKVAGLVIDPDADRALAELELEE